MEEISSPAPRRRRQNYTPKGAKALSLSQNVMNQILPPAPTRLEKSCRSRRRQIIMRSGSIDKVTHHAGLTVPSVLPPPAGGVKRRRNTEQQEDQRSIQQLGFIEEKKKRCFDFFLSPCQKNECRGRNRTARRWRWEEHRAQTLPALTSCLHLNVCF